MTAQRERLLDLLAGLGDAEWGSPAAAPQWSVKDIALHLINVDLSWVARFRDHDQAGSISKSSGHEAFVRGLAHLQVRGIIVKPELHGRVSRETRPATLRAS